MEPDALATIQPAGARSCAALDAYELTAEHYDDFTAGHDYPLWLGNLFEALSACGLRASTASSRRLLDLGCGTGKSFLGPLEDGWEVLGVDLSPAMLARARAKAGGRARLECHDMRALPRLGSFDLVWALDDALNYVLDPAGLEDALRGIERNLAPQGLGLFDLNTLAVYRGFFAETHLVDTGGRRLRWSGRSDVSFAPGDIADAHLEALDPRGSVRSRSLHRQRHHPPAEVHAAVGAAGLRVAAVHGHGFDARLEQPLDESRHTKAIYIVEKRDRR